ncbi:MAG: TolC family protein, partial [Planctomycetia bacterium]|nr:TolC family protein [Planctomycetia bacterium]
ASATTISTSVSGQQIADYEAASSLRVVALQQQQVPRSTPPAAANPTATAQPPVGKPMPPTPSDSLAPPVPKVAVPKVIAPKDPYTASPPGALPIENVATPPLDAQPGTTLQEVEFMAMTGNPALRESSAKVGVAQGNAVQVGMLPNPGFFSSSPQWAGSISQYNAVFSQEFITAGKLRLSRATAQRAVEQAQLDFTRTRFEVLTNVRRQYYTTATAQRRVEVLEQLLGVSSRSRDVGQKLLAAGETNRADATLLEIEYDRAELAHQNAVSVLDASRKRLAAVIGVAEMEIGRLQFDLTTPLPEYELEAVRLGVVDRNAVAAIAAVEIQRTQWALRRAMAEPYPDFNIQGGYQYAVEGPNHQQGYAQFTTTIPLWNRNQGGIRSARADTVRAVAALQRTENELSQQTADALGTYIPAVERARIYRERILPKAQEVFRVNRSLFEQGQTDFLRLLQSQRTLIEADLGYIEAEEARWTSAAIISGLLQQEQFP